MKKASGCGARPMRLQVGLVPGETASQRMERERQARLKALADQEAGFAAKDAANAAIAPARGPVILAPSTVPASQPVTTPTITPQPTVAAQPAAATKAGGGFGAAVKGISGRGIEELGKIHGFKKGFVPRRTQPFVKAPPGVPKEGDHIPALLEHDEAVLPGKTVQAIGKKKLVQIIQATNDGKKPKIGARRGGKYEVGLVPDDGWFKKAMPGTAATYRGAGEDIRSAYGAGGIPAAIGATVRAAPAYGVAVADDLLRSAGKVIDPAANALKTAVTGDPTPIGSPAAAPATATATTARPPVAVQPAPSPVVQAPPAAPAQTAPQTLASIPSGTGTITNTSTGKVTALDTRGMPARPAVDMNDYSRPINADQVRPSGPSQDNMPASTDTWDDMWRKKIGRSQQIEGERQKQAAIRGYGVLKQVEREGEAHTQALGAGKTRGMIEQMSLKQQQRLQALQDDYAKAAPEARAGIAEQIRVMTGKDKPASYKGFAIPGGTDEMGNRLPSRLGVLNEQTGQTSLSGDASAQKFEVGKTYRDKQGNKATFKGYDQKGNPVFG